MGIEGYKFVQTYAAYAHMCLFSLGAVLEEKFVKQNGRFEEFLYSNVSVKYYGKQWLLEEKYFSKSPHCSQSVLSLWLK